MNPARPAVLLDTPQGSIPLKYTIEPLPDSSDGQVAATIARMCEYVNADYHSPYVKYDAQCALQCDSDPLVAVHKFVRGRMRFRRDEETAQPFEGALPYGDDAQGQRQHFFVEALKRPVDVSLEYATTGQPVAGDCDDYSMYCAALLRALGIDCCFATVGADKADPTVFSHVYVVAYWRGGRYAMDCSHGPYAGWECPNRFGKFAEWAIWDRAAWGSVGLGILLLGGLAWRYRKELREILG